MKSITLQTTRKVVPMIYAYTTPEISRHHGWTKIGYTEQSVDQRLKQQTHTADVLIHEEWRGNAVFDDGSGETFTDHDFHAYLAKQGVQRKQGTEWFHVSGDVSKHHFYDFRANRGILKQSDAALPYTLRAEQERAVSQTLAYARDHENGEYLWNAKPRFGKTLSVYDFCKRMQAKNVLIVTNRPAIANSWYDDYERFLGRESGYLFVSQVEALRNRKYVLSCKDYIDALPRIAGKKPGCIEFVSLQDLKGSIHFGGEFDKLKEVKDILWDVLVVDEAHEGVDTYKTDVAFDQITRRFTLHLSGTPFKALANDKFEQAAIFNWTYADEQNAKQTWDDAQEQENPYANLPRLNMYTYQMGEIIREEIEQGIEIEGTTEEYAFDLNLFFETKNGSFVHDASVNRFLTALTTQEKFPFSTEALRGELTHTFWLLNRVESAKALAKKLAAHPVFGKYKVILAAGDGRLSEEEETQNAFQRVTEAIHQIESGEDRQHVGTITLSVGQLTTGVTVPEWSAVLMLSNIKSPALYMQAAFRAQNPCLFKRGGDLCRKQNAYVFDFDPARTLMIFESFANDLCESTSDGRGDSDTRKAHVRELLNFFPVIGEDEQGEMVALDAEQVLSIPRRIRSQEVVRRGFMSDFLFQNIAHVFHAPAAVLEILNQLPAVQEPKAAPQLNAETAEKLSVDESGEVSLSDGFVIGRSAEVFGDKIFRDLGTQLKDTIAEIQHAQPKRTDEALEMLKAAFHQQAVTPILETAREAYGGELRASEQKRLDRKLTTEAESLVGHAYGSYAIERKALEQERRQQLADSGADEHEAIHQHFNELQRQADEELRATLAEAVDSFVQAAGQEVVRTVETQQREQEKHSIEDSVRNKLRGFSRTIPSFLMAYGGDGVTLETFDTIIPDQVFVDVTGITLAQFRFLRDGGERVDSETGERKHFDGQLFDPVVFNDSVKEFLHKREALADYFDESHTEDIFDYIPPQKTNQIFTPKWVVRKMVDLLEEENPGCFDQPDKTFADLYMKSGLYIAEIVKRLYQSEGMKQAFPDSTERLRHIFAHQVYGLAPTEIIYRIALSFVLGFAREDVIPTHHLRMVDALALAREGILEEKLEEMFGD